MPGVLPNAPEVHPAGPTVVDAASTESIQSDAEDQRMSAGHFDWERDGASDVEVGFVQEVPEVEPLAVPVRMRNIASGMASLDVVNLKTVFERRACVMRSAPHFFRGALRASFRMALNKIVRGCEASDRTRQIRGWKLFMLLPRMSLHRPPRGGLVPRGRRQVSTFR